MRQRVIFTFDEGIGSVEVTWGDAKEPVQTETFDAKEAAIARQAIAMLMETIAKRRDDQTLLKRVLSLMPDPPPPATAE